MRRWRFHSCATLWAMSRRPANDTGGAVNEERFGAEKNMQSTRVKMMRSVRERVRLLAAAAGCALLAGSVRASTPGFTVTEEVSSGPAISSMARAGELHEGFIESSSTATGRYSVVNFKAPDESNRMHFADPAEFPVAEPRHDHNFTMRITGEIEIPKAGEYSFGVKSNGGFNVQVGEDSMHRNAASGSSTRIEPMRFASAGTYAVDLTYYENAPRASLELFASDGKFHRFHARGADFQLVGDSADGGLSFAPAVDSVPTATGAVAPGDTTTSGQVTGATAVPEPSGIVITLLAVPWVLTRRSRRPGS
jgi:hypothetical protein